MNRLLVDEEHSYAQGYESLCPRLNRNSLEKHYSLKLRGSYIPVSHRSTSFSIPSYFLYTVHREPLCSQMFCVYMLLWYMCLSTFSFSQELSYICKLFTFVQFGSPNSLQSLVSPPRTHSNCIILMLFSYFSIVILCCHTSKYQFDS